MTNYTYSKTTSTKSTNTSPTKSTNFSIPQINKLKHKHYNYSLNFVVLNKLIVYLKILGIVIVYGCWLWLNSISILGIMLRIWYNVCCLVSIRRVSIICNGYSSRWQLLVSLTLGEVTMLILVSYCVWFYIKILC